MAIKEGLEAEGKSVGVLEVPSICSKIQKSKLLGVLKITSKVNIIGRFKGHFKSQNI